MEKFNFNLQRVLDYKIKVEDIKKEEFVKSLKSYMYEEKVLNVLNDKRKLMFEAVSSFKTSQEFQNYSRYMEYLNKKIENQINVLNKSKEKLNNSKEELIKSTADRKILDKLKEKAKEEFDREENKKEQKLNDDFAMFSYLKNERRWK